MATQQSHLYDLINDFDTAMLVTYSAGARGLHARPMAVAELKADGDAYFATSIDSTKVAEIENDPRVTVTFQGRAKFAAVAGTAHIERDPAMIDRLWKEAWRVWFPKGKDDPSLCLIRVEAEEGEYWDNAGAKGFKYAIEALRAYVAQDRPKTNPDQHGKVKL